MKREQKQQFVDDMRGRFMDAPLVILTDFQGSTVKELEGIRRECEPEGIHFRVVKNTLSKRAVSGTPLESLAPLFRGNVAVMFSGGDPIAAAKVFVEQQKKNKKLIARGGFFEDAVLDEAGVGVVAELPSKDELLVMLLRTLTEAPRRVLGVVRAPARDILYLLKNYATKLEEEG